jgi:hypothetical protein
MSKKNPKKSEQKDLNTTDEDFVKFKKDEIKKAAKKGNYGKARREAMELHQYLGTSSNEMPIEDSLETFE